MTVTNSPVDTTSRPAMAWPGRDLSPARIGLPGTTMPSGPLPPGQWADLLEAASQERLTGTLQWAVWSGRLPATDTQVRELFDLHLTAAAHVVRLEQELAVASSALADEGIAHRVLKGPAVARLDYPDPGMRTFTDIDILVPNAEMAAAVRALGYLGYQRRLPALRDRYDYRFAMSVPLVSRDGLEIDVHRTLISGPASVRMDLRGVWDGGQPVHIAGRDIHALTQEQRLVHASIAVAARPQPPTGPALRDLAQMLLAPGLDPDAALVTANRWDVRPLLSHAVALTVAALGLADDALGWWTRTTGRAPTDPEPLAGDWARWLPLYQGAIDSRPPLATETVRQLEPRQRAAFMLAVVAPHRSYLRSRGVGRLEYMRSGMSRWFYRP